MAKTVLKDEMTGKDNSMQKILGEWYGVYHYLGRQQFNPRTPSTRFRATVKLVPGTNHVTGKVVDESFMGEAEISGSCTDHSIQFMKIYHDPELPPGLSVAPILYEGTLSDDGTTLSGIWSIKQRFLKIFPVTSVYGTWEAYREPF